jgi:hypothetical protein
MRVEHNCFICGDLVLGIQGQDDNFEPYYVEDEREALAAGKYGPCHVLCLVTSHWGEYWSRQRIRHMEETLGLPRVFELGGLVVFQNTREQAAIVVRQDGAEFKVAYSSPVNAREIPGGHLLPVKQAWNLYLPQHPQVVRKIREALLQSGSYPLPELTSALDLDSRLLYPSALEQGQLRIEKPNSKKSQQRIKSWSERFVSAEAVYAQFIPDAVMEAVRLTKPFHGSTNSWKLS